MDISGRTIFISSNMAKFLSILLCFFISVLNINFKKINFNNIILPMGLFLTVAADYIFLIQNKNFSLAIGLFSLVQLLYIYRYNIRNWKSNFTYLFIVYLAICTIYLYINIFIIRISFLYPIALFYGICLLISLKESIILYICNLYPSPNKELILLGMVLFVLCDINVAIYNIIKNINNRVFILIWLFYLPSQLLLSLSEKT